MSTAMSEIRGISDANVTALKSQGLSDSDSLLEAAQTPGQRTALARATGIGTADLLELVNRADLARIKGIGQVYSDLMEQAGVDTIAELARRVPANLHARMIEINTTKQLTSRPPSPDQVADFVEQAKALPRLIEY
jgi:predicted flap endonuclease-1-like 5' DNA nuclease